MKTSLTNLHEPYDTLRRLHDRLDKKRETERTMNELKDGIWLYCYGSLGLGNCTPFDNKHTTTHIILKHSQDNNTKKTATHAKQMTLWFSQLDKKGRHNVKDRLAMGNTKGSWQALTKP